MLQKLKSKKILLIIAAVIIAAALAVVIVLIIRGRDGGDVRLLPLSQTTATASSTWTDGIYLPAENAVSGVPGYWHSARASETPGEDLYITVDIGGVYEVTRLIYSGRDSQWTNSVITRYAIYVSLHEDGPFTRVATGTWSGEHREVEQADFTPVEARFVRLMALESTSYDEHGARNVADTSNPEDFVASASMIRIGVVGTPDDEEEEVVEISTIIMDRWGQFSWYDWEGKLPDDLEGGTAQLRAEWEEDQARYAGLIRDPELFDRFGGFRVINGESGYVGNDTGFFQLRLIDGIWWFVTPDGYLFLANGVTTANYFDASGLGTRIRHGHTSEYRGLFEYLPDRERYHLAYSGSGPNELINFLVYNLMVKYDTTDHDTLVERVAEVMEGRFIDWGINTFAKWGTLPGLQIPTMVSLRTPAWHGSANPTFFPGIEDPFGHDFVDNILATWDQQHDFDAMRYDPFIIGFTFHNEVGFELNTINAILMHEYSGGRAGINVIDRITPAKRAFARHAEAWFTERHGSSEAGLTRFIQLYSNITPAGGGGMNQEAWIDHVRAIQSWEDVIYTTIPYWWNVNAQHSSMTYGYVFDNEDSIEMHEQIFDFIAYASQTYYRRVREALMLRAPNHLFLGTSSVPHWHSTIEWDLAGAEYLDAISIDFYSQNYNWMNDELRGLRYTDPGLPLLNLEMGFGVPGRGMRVINTAVTAPNHDARGRLARAYIEGQFRSPYFVGFGWFQLFDQNVGGRPIDAVEGGENFQYGFLNQQDQAYYEFIEHVRQALHNSGSIHAQSEPTTNFVPRTVTFDGNGGTAGVSSMVVYRGHTMRMTAGDMPTAQRDGYIFTGWNTAPDGTKTNFTADRSISANVTLYAQWEAAN